MEQTSEIKHTKQVLTFLNAIHGGNPVEIRLLSQRGSSSILLNADHIFCNSTKQKKIKKCQNTPKNFDEVLTHEYLRSEGGHVFFTVNSPNVDKMDSCFTSDKHIKEGGKINSQFVDIDAPKEVRGNELNLKQWKKGVKDQILSFPLRPSIVVDTKNGYHVYWLLENGETKLFRHLQMQLIQHFNGDPACVNHSRVLRLPFFMHRKDPKKPYPVTVKILETEKKYLQEELKSELPELEEKTITKVLKTVSKSPVPIVITDARKHKLLNLIQPKVNTVKLYDDKVTMHCCMPDHPDRNPSAWIDTSYMWYHCSGCNSHYSIEELAEELGWKDVLEELNRYDIDIQSELIKIREQAISVSVLNHLGLNSSEEERVNVISNKVIEVLLKQYGQVINEYHTKCIYDIVTIMYKANKDKPYLVPLDMGSGKTTIINIFLHEMIREGIGDGAIVVVERRKDAKQIANELNESIGEKVAYSMYGFDKHECLLNVTEGNEYETCVSKKTFNCPYMEQCRYWQQSEKQRNYPVVVITSQRMLQHSKVIIDNYGYYYSEGESKDKRKRELLIIDEKPKLNYVKSINNKAFYIYAESILSKIRRYQNTKNNLYTEYSKLINMLKPLFNVDELGRKIIEPLDDQFKLSKEFISLFRRIFDYSQKGYEIPFILESIVRNGCHREVSKDKVTLTTSYRQNYYWNDFKTIVFDGTADIDLDYQHEDYHLIDFRPIRTYENLTIYQCDLVSGSKSSMKNEDRLNALCEDVKRIADENPKEKIFFPVFKANKDDVCSYLEEYIHTGRVKVAHYGSTRGSNSYKDCSIVILGGILHKTENYYIGKSMALSEKRGIGLTDTTCSNYDKVRRFNNSSLEVIKILDMIVDYSQELKRSKQRDNSTNIKGKVYIFHNDKILLDMIRMKFPNCTVVNDWTPENLIEVGIFNRRNNKNVQAVCKYIQSNLHRQEIYYDEIRESLGLKKQQFSNIMNQSKDTIAYIKAKGYVVEKDGRKKKLMKV